MTSQPNDTLIIYGRYWYDFVTIAWVVGFFLIECLLLFKNSLIGWAMTAKCLVLAGVFAWTLLHPPIVLPPEDVTLGALVIRILLIGVLGFVIVLLTIMRLRKMNVFFSADGDTSMRDKARDEERDPRRDIERDIRRDPHRDATRDVARDAREEEITNGG